LRESSSPGVGEYGSVEVGRSGRGQALEARTHGRLVADQGEIGRAGDSFGVEAGAVDREHAVDLEVLGRELLRRGGVGRHAERQRGDDARLRAAGARCGLGECRHDVLLDVHRPRHPGQSAVAQLAAQLEHLRHQGADEQRERVAAGDVQGGVHLVHGAVDVALPVARQVAHDRQVLAHVGDRLFVRDAEHVLDHHLMAAAEPEGEPAAAGGIHRRRLLRERVRMARIGGNHRGAELDLRCPLAGQRQHREGVEAEDVGQPHRREAVRLRPHDAVDELLRSLVVAAAQRQSDLHCPFLLSCNLDTHSRAPSITRIQVA
jgi:hypothetical protein